MCDTTNCSVTHRKLKNTKAALEQKSAFLAERMRDYQMYLQTVQKSTSSPALKVGGEKGEGKAWGGGR